jgi:hypothetical protein
MASRFWEFITNMVAGQTARAEQVNSQLQGVDGALGLVANELNRTIRFTSGTPAEADFQLTQTPAQRSNLLLGFNQAGAVELKSGAFTWRGDWVATALYNVNDMVRAPVSHDQSLMVCTAQHVSSVFATDFAASRWAIAVDLSQVERAVKKFFVFTGTAAQLNAGQDMFANTAAGLMTLTLPASPLISDQPINICHVGGNNNIVIARNGQRIMGLLEDMTVDVLVTPNASFELAYSNATFGWRLIKGT